MIINLVSNLGEDFNPDLILQYNTAITSNLKKALEEEGHDVNLVRDHTDEAPKANHTIVISNWAMKKLRADPLYLIMLREATDGKLGLWLDAAFGGMDDIYDVVLTVTPPYLNSGPKFKWVGFAADPELFYPEQGLRPTAFVDSYAYGWHNGSFNHIFDTLQAVLKTSEVDVIQPILQYNTGKRIPWDQLAGLFRRCHFSIVTQLGHWGLTNIETATCGALLVIHKSMDRPNTWPCKLNHVIWETSTDLEEILKGPVDVETNRAQALENSWAKVVARIEEALR